MLPLEGPGTTADGLPSSSALSPRPATTIAAVDDHVAELGCEVLQPTPRVGLHHPRGQELVVPVRVAVPGVDGPARHTGRRRASPGGRRHRTAEAGPTRSTAEVII